jgi:hypothetical protein
MPEKFDFQNCYSRLHVGRLLAYCLSFPLACLGKICGWANITPAYLRYGSEQSGRTSNLLTSRMKKAQTEIEKADELIRRMMYRVVLPCRRHRRHRRRTTTTALCIYAYIYIYIHTHTHTYTYLTIKRSTRGSRGTLRLPCSLSYSATSPPASTTKRPTACPSLVSS